MYRTKKMIAMALMLFLSALVLPSVSLTLIRVSVVGAVYAEGNVPILGATVTVTGPNCSEVSTTDSAGKYQITSGLGTDTCSITVAAPGYLDKTVSNVLVTAGSTTSAPSIFLKRSGMVSGIVKSLTIVGPPPPPT